MGNIVHILARAMERTKYLYYIYIFLQLVDICQMLKTKIESDDKFFSKKIFYNIKIVYRL